MTEPLVAIGPSGAFDANSAISVAELVARKPIMPASANRLRALFDDAAEEAGLSATADLEVDSVPALLELVAAGAGVSILPYSTVAGAVKEGRLSYSPIAPEKLERHLVLARPAERIETPLWNAVADLLLMLLRSREESCHWSVDKDA